MNLRHSLWFQRLSRDWYGYSATFYGKEELESLSFWGGVFIDSGSDRSSDLEQSVVERRDVHSHFMTANGHRLMAIGVFDFDRRS